MKLIDQIREEAGRFKSFYGQNPDCVYLGEAELAEFRAAVASIARLGLVVTTPSKGMAVDGIPIIQVEKRSYLAFGLDQPSPCG